jgi:hypothetical protein
MGFNLACKGLILFEEHIKNGFHSCDHFHHLPPSSARVKECVELYLQSFVCFHGVVLK